VYDGTIDGNGMVGVRLGMFDEEMVLVGRRDDVDVVIVDINDGELLIVVVGA
jgi:hypothetical protein